MADTTFSPLVWPEGIERTASPIVDRRWRRVRTGVAHVLRAIESLGAVTSRPASATVLSFDGARGTQTADCGVAVWFVWGEVQRCVACDLYTSPSANLFAAAQLIEGCVAEHGRGSTAAVEHALAYYALRARTSSVGKKQEHWSEVLGVRHDASAAEVTAAFRRRALDVHPDKGGTREQWDDVRLAVEQARLGTVTRGSAQQKWEIPYPEKEEAVWNNLFPSQTF